MLTHLDLRKTRCLDGLHYSFEILKYYYVGLHDSCCKITADNSNVIPALASCWGFVDALHRIREIALSTPGVNARNQEMRAFLGATELAEEFRHYIQHLRGELSHNPPNTFPVWGTLAWVDRNNNKRTYIAILGAQIQGTNNSGCVYDTVKKEWVSMVCLGVNQKSFNFDLIYKASLRFQDYIIPHLVESASDEVTFHEKLPIITVELNH